MNKLEGMPKITYINLAYQRHKKEHMENMFKKHEVSNYQRFDAIRPTKSFHQYLNRGEMGCMLSHLSIIIDFYKNSKEDTTIIMEDDADISTYKNWNFSWREFIKAMPDFEVLQIIRNQEFEQKHAKLKQWHWTDKSTAGYIITQEYAKKVHDIYKKSPKNLKGFPNLSDDPEYLWKDVKIGPVADYALYKNLNSWSTSIFNQVLFAGQGWSSTSNSQSPPTWFIKQHKQMNRFWSTKHGLEDIL